MAERKMQDVMMERMERGEPALKIEEVKALIDYDFKRGRDLNEIMRVNTVELLKILPNDLKEEYKREIKNYIGFKVVQKDLNASWGENHPMAKRFTLEDYIKASKKAEKQSVDTKQPTSGLVSSSNSFSILNFWKEKAFYIFTILFGICSAGIAIIFFKEDFDYVRYDDVPFLFSALTFAVMLFATLLFPKKIYRILYACLAIPINILVPLELTPGKNAIALWCVLILMWIPTVSWKKILEYLRSE